MYSGCKHNKKKVFWDYVNRFKWKVFFLQKQLKNKDIKLRRTTHNHGKIWDT